MKTAIGDIVAVATKAEIPQNLEDGTMIYVTATNEIYFKTNNNLVCMQSDETSNCDKISTEELKRIIKEVLKEDDEILELKQLFVGCLSKEFEKYLDCPEQLLDKIIDSKFGNGFISRVTWTMEEVSRINNRLGSHYPGERDVLYTLRMENDRLKQEVSRLNEQTKTLQYQINNIQNQLNKNESTGN